MKKFNLIPVLLLCTIFSFAQSYPGYRSSNYTGVNGVFFNPASIADSRYRWDVNLFSIHAGIGNNNLSFKIKNIDDTFGDKADSLLFGAGNKPTNGLINVDAFGPSFMFNTSRKTSFAITTRFRTMANVQDLDGNLTNAINNTSLEQLPVNINAHSQKITINGWTDIGASMATVLVDNGRHFLKGGLTLKYLAGTANSYTHIEDLKGTIDVDILDDPYLTNATGSIGLGYAGLDFDDFEAQDALKFNGHGFGGDLGFIYEFRPDADKTGRSQNKYKFKAGVSLMDIGTIKYTPKPADFGNYTVNVPAGQKFYLSELDDKSLSETKTYLDGSPFFTNTSATQGSYNVKLPTNVLVDLDLAVSRLFYLNLGSQLNLANKNDRYGSYYHNSATFTPRFEGKVFGVFLPLNYNELTKFNAGISFRLGPVFFGSGSILTALFDNSKQADVHFGLRFGGLQKKVRKVKEAPMAVTVVEPMKTEATPLVLDTDSDGILDSLDKCPTVPGLARYDGCPIPDIDGDGINDELDKCPALAGFSKYDGCPIPDTDKDGINDESDACPTIAGVVKYKGCPIPDTDKDGVNDDEDKCPTVAGTVANNGCPEIKADVRKKVSVAAKSILFATGSTKLLATSNKGLNDVVKIMKENPNMNISVDGHTDNTGNADKNQMLSESRATTVKKYFINKGIDESRITAAGHGSDTPIADNKTAAGRIKNRRVELTLNY